MNNITINGEPFICNDKNIVSVNGKIKNNSDNIKM